MASVLLTGGTGTLGRFLVPALVSRGHDVRVVIHRTAQLPDSVEGVHVDLVTGNGLESALDGVDTILHAATHPGRGAHRFEIGSTSTLVAAAERTGAHLIYVSIVGVDHHRLKYYRAKWEAEQLIENSDTKWSIQRATQFYGLIEAMLSKPVFVKAPGLAFQPVAAVEVASRLVDVVESGPSGRVTDFGGPELLGIRTLARRRRQATGRQAHLVKVPRIGPMKDFVRGAHLSPRHRDGTITWEQWLTSRDEHVRAQH